MKTSVLSFGALSFLLLAFLNPTLMIGQTANMTQTVDYGNSPRPLNASNSKKMPYEYPNFESWAKIQNDEVIWLYLFNENYRVLVNNWNKINNPFWAAAIVGSSPYGTFDFTAGLSKAKLVKNYGDLKEYNRYNYNLNPVRPNNNLGQPHYVCRVERANSHVLNIQPSKLPTRNPQLTTVKNYTVAQPNFTKNIPTSTIYVNRAHNMNFQTGYSRRLNRGSSSSMLSTNQSYYEQGIGGTISTFDNNSFGNTGNQYNNHSNTKGSSNSSSVSKTSQPGKTVSTSGTTTASPSKQ